MNPEPSATNARAGRSLFASPFVWLAAFFILNISVPFFDIPNRATAIGGAIALTFAYVCIVVLFAVSIASLRLPMPRVIGFGVLALALWLLMDNVIAPYVAQPIVQAARAAKERPEGWPLLQLIGLGTLSDMALMSLGVCAGVLGARLIRTPNMLGPICIVIALIDVWGVLFGGIVTQLLEKAPEVAAKAMTTGPQLGAATSSRYSIPLPDIGIGDYLFLGLLFGALFYLSLNWRAATAWVIPLVAFALLAITFGLIPALPGLLFIAIGVAIPNLNTFQYTREEKFALLYAGVFVLILTGVLYAGFKSALPDKKPDKKPEGAEISKAMPVTHIYHDMNYNSIRLTKPQPALVSSEEVAQLEKQLGTKMPGGYQKFVTTFGMGILNDTVHVYTPKRISRELNNFQQRWKEHWFWDEGNNILRKEKALEAIIIADTVNGDELIFHPSQPDKLYLLPHESGQIFECGSSLNEAIE